MHKVTFYPIGNADSVLISLSNEKYVLFDYADKADKEDEDDKRIDLASELEQTVDNDFDVVAFTHADDDHIHGFSDFFYLEHAKKYQSEDRKKITTLWVPAAIVLEENLEDEANVLRSEARYRLKNGKGIRVFSKPEALSDWLKSEDLSIEERSDCITSAGEIVPEFNFADDAIEFFVHSPFVDSVDDKSYDRNDAGLVMQATFKDNDEITRLILGADIHYEVWEDIVKITKHYDRIERLTWDIFKISHHCSYKALSDEKGSTKTIPTEDIKWLFEQGEDKGYLVATCKPIPTNDDDDQPPHRQAANFYEGVAESIVGEFVVTMEHPNSDEPKPVIFNIDESKATLEKNITAAAIHLTSKSSPRAG
jgi:ribonuclease BN (tRNA processing enzyme)